MGGKNVSRRRIMMLRDERTMEYYYQHGIQPTADKFGLPYSTFRDNFRTYTEKTNKIWSNIIVDSPSFLPYSHEFPLYWDAVLNNVSYAEDFYQIANSYPNSSLALNNLFNRVFKVKNPNIIAKRIIFIRNYNKRKFGYRKPSLNEYANINISKQEVINSINSSVSLKASSDGLNIDLNFLVNICRRDNIIRTNNPTDKLIAEHKDYLESGMIAELIAEINETVDLIKNNPLQYQNEYLRRINF